MLEARNIMSARDWSINVNLKLIDQCVIGETL